MSWNLVFGGSRGVRWCSHVARRGLLSWGRIVRTHHRHQRSLLCCARPRMLQRNDCSVDPIMPFNSYCCSRRRRGVIRGKLRDIPTDADRGGVLGRISNPRCNACREGFAELLADGLDFNQPQYRVVLATILPHIMSSQVCTRSPNFERNELSSSNIITSPNGN